jgi:diaminopimelate epimerase
MLTVKKMQGTGNTFYLVDMRDIDTDGVLLVTKSDIADAAMLIFNADGSEAEMCGNGIRCTAKHLGKTKVKIATKSGIKTVTQCGNNWTVSMGKEIKNPHKVIICNDLEKITVPDYSATNVEFIKIISPTELQMRVFERGVGETKACGTGAAASVCEMIKQGHCPAATDITVKCRGGNLIVKAEADGEIILKGGAEDAKN